MAQSPSSLAPDLAAEFPRSPRETLAGFVVAARTLDKCRADVAGTLGEYHFDCPLDKLFFDFTGIGADEFREKVAAGAEDEAIAEWLNERTSHIDRREVIRWNNQLRDRRISEMPIELQEFLETYIPENILPGRVIHHWFDVYDIEEGRI